MKRSLRILHLYPDLLDLYGDGGNLLALQSRLAAMGHDVAVDALELGAPCELGSYDLLYVGAGKSRNLAAALTDLFPRREALRAAVDAGRTVLATGSGMLLLGQGLQLDGRNLPGAGIFSYCGIETGAVRVSDCVVSLPGLDGELYGFSNQTAEVLYTGKPNLFSVRVGAVGGNGREGMRERNCYATSLLGPLLAKNPHFLKMLLRDLLGEDFVDYDDRLATLALQKTLDEF